MLQTISHYRILNQLGAGGMGEVYLAEDSRLGRQVALKFLPASYQYDPNRRARFLQEARAASALRSPNIAAIYDIGEQDQMMFIAMEYVEGDTLARRIAASPLQASQAVDIAVQIAAALDEAHQLGIVHRDIKSSNLIVTPRGMVKVLDFGLAKIIDRIDAPDSQDRTAALGEQTSAGVVMGTVSYMSPEQALGRGVDNRSDIFSLGVVIYEMLTGKLPFAGANSTEIIDKIIHEEPAPISRFSPDAPEEFIRISRKCLEKDRESRYQSAREIATDLRNLRRDLDSGAVTGYHTARQAPVARNVRSRKAIDSLAILPLVNAGNDPDAEYLSDGITESIINNLSQLPKLKVMSRSTVFHYKDKQPDPREVGRNLGVRAVLTGRLLQRGDKLVIKVELVDALDGSHLWGDQYNRDLADIFTVEEEISNVISEKLRLKLSGAQKKKLAKRHTKNAEAYRLYLKGRYYWNRRTAEDLRKGIEFFKRAIIADPNYALAYAGVADSYNILASYSALAPKEAFPKAKAAATIAVELDDNLAEGHTSLAFITFGFEWRFADAEREFKRAIELNPGYATAHLWYALYLAAMNRMDEALAEIARAEELDPLSLPINTNAGFILYLARRYDEAIEKYQKTLELEKDFVLARRRLGQAYEQVGKYAEALTEFESCLKLAPRDNETMAALGHLYAVTGEQLRAEKIIQELIELSSTRYVSSYLIGSIYAALRESDAAFECLDRAFEEAYGFLTYLLVAPIFDPLRNDPRFKGLANRVGLGQ